MDEATSAKYGSTLRQKISDEGTQSDPKYYGAEFAPPTDKGTSHVSVYAPNGDAVSATHSINDWFGAAYRSPNLGIIYNNEMDDFSTPGISTRFGFPPTPSNYIHPGKRPVSSMAPFILVDKNGKVKLVIGCSGGPKIITATVFVMAYKVWFGEETGESVVHPRLHHPLVPNIVEYETKRAVPDYILNGLKKLGHNLTDVDRPEYSACQIVYYEGPGKLFAKSDPRKYGHSAGF